MTRFPKMDFSKMDFSKFDLSKTMDFAKLGAAMGDPERARRSARLMETTAELGRRQKAAYAAWAEARRRAEADGAATSEAGTIDMVPPAAADGAWTVPGTGTEPGGQPSTSPQGDIAAGVMRTIQESLAKAGLGANLGAGVGTGPGSSARPPVAVPPGARFEERTFTSAAGSRDYKVYVPSGYAGKPLPVVVMLHGCTQDPDDFAAGTRMNALAEEQTFLVAYPAQPRSANMQRCWNWYEVGDQQREGGEPALIAGLTRQVVAEFSADPSRVYVAGLSAGGAAAAILAATHPDLFAAVGVHSGLACGAARDVPSAFAAMKGGGATPAGRSRHAVPIIVFHGDDDRTVHPANGDQVIAQSTIGAASDEAVSQGRTPDGMAYTRTVRSDASGRAVLEQWVLHGAGHAWSGGSPAGSYTDPRGPDASREMVRFFLAHANAAGSVRH